MRIDDWLSQATEKLTQASIGSARLDCLILLEDNLERDRSWLLAHPETSLTTEQLNRLNRQVRARSRHTPLAQIRGFSEFYGRRFLINKFVLEPRPESETMIELLKMLALPKNPIIADVGTGSGALGITAALELAGAQVDLYDIDSNCLAVARHNSVLHELRLHILKRDLLNRPLRHYHVVLANLPYVPTDWMTSPSIKMEPSLAIDGGVDGLHHYRRLFLQLSRQRVKPRFILTEALPPQHQALAEIAGQSNFDLKATQDFIQIYSSNR